jgi:NADH:ubiquinone oxidoreductase subunit 3 (subunit A)
LDLHEFKLHRHLRADRHTYDCGRRFCHLPAGDGVALVKEVFPPQAGACECGLESKTGALIRFRPEYYLYAIVFLIFDVEAIFLLPFAVAFTGLTVGASITMLIFLLLLAEGLVWTWRKGVLTWV